MSLITMIITNDFQQADNFTNSLGVLQQFANPSQFPGFGNKTPQQQQQSEGKFNLLTSKVQF